jgi:hypothetical protein
MHNDLGNRTVSIENIYDNWLCGHVCDSKTIMHFYSSKEHAASRRENGLEAKEEEQLTMRTFETIRCGYRVRLLVHNTSLLRGRGQLGGLQ